MKDLIRKILREVEEDDLDWIPKSFDMLLGDNFTEEDVCKDTNDNCKIELKGDNFIFRLKPDDWRENFTRIYEDDWYFLQDLLSGYDRYYSGMEMDIDEFNYVGYKFDDENIAKLNFLIEKLDIGNNFDYYKDNSEMMELFENFNSIKENRYIIDDVISELETSLSENRWEYLKSVFNDLNDMDGVNFEMYGDYLQITIDADKVFEDLEKDSNLTDIVKKYSERLDYGWTDSYYNEWNTEGSEDAVNRSISGYLDSVIEELEENPIFKSRMKLKEILTKLGFEKVNGHKWEKIINLPKYHQTFSFTAFNINYEDEDLILKTEVFDNKNDYNKIYRNRVTFDDIPEHVNNYKLDI